MRATSHCRGCGAAISVGEPACWACGAATAAPVVAPAPGDYHHPCPACGRLTAVYHRTCPKCGFALSQRRLWDPSHPPKGWLANRLPDGSVQLQRTRAGHVVQGGGPAALVIVLAVAYALQLIYRGHPGGVSPFGPFEAVFFGLTVVAIALVFLAAAAWLAFGTEEWRLHPDLLEVRRALFGKRWIRRYAPGALLVREVDTWSRSGQRRSYRLVVCASGRDQVLVDTSWSGLVDLQELGEYIAAVTGWRFSSSGDFVSPGWLG